MIRISVVLAGFLLAVSGFANANDVAVRMPGVAADTVVQIDTKIFVSSAVGDRLTIELPGGQTVLVKHDRREWLPSGNLYWGGIINDAMTAHRTDLVIADGVVKGTISTPYGNFYLEPGVDGVRVRPARSVTSAHDDDVVVPVVGASSHAGAKDLGDIEAQFALGDTSTEVVTIDVLLHYTPGVAKRQGSNLQLHLDQIWGQVRAMCAVSDTRINLRLVGAEPVAYTAADDIFQVVHDASDADAAASSGSGKIAPGFENLFKLRTGTGADLVVVLADSSDLVHSCAKNNCAASGVAAIPSVPTWKFMPDLPVLFYAAVEDSDYVGVHVAHELGHLMGADHDRITGCNGGGLFSYSCGLMRNARDGGGTVMSYAASSQNWGVFSNPSLTVCGGACGIAEGAPDSADNARTLRRSRYIIARYQATKIPDALSDVTGMWWSPSESGWGLTIYQRRDIGFVAWYTYDRDGVPKWYVASDCRFANSTCTGKLYETVYGVGLDIAGAFDPTKVGVREVGQVTMDFASSAKATLTYTIRGVPDQKSVERMVFRTTGPVGTFDWNGLWWNSAESGWGMSVTQQFDTIFAAWYSYGDDGKPTWYVASNCTLTATRDGCTGELYATTGPAGPEQQPGFDASKVHVRVVGNLALTFSGAGSGQMQYTVNGKTATRRISRQQF